MSKFRPLDAYEPNSGAGYKLLPLRFANLDDARYVATNMVGEYLVLDRDTINSLVRHRLDPRSDVYRTLKAKHFIADASSILASELLALKWRTKSHRLANFTALHMFVVTLRCEHSCPYCQVSRQSDDRVAFDMAPETAARAVELAFRSPSPAIKIEFQGGEPLLAFDMIRQIVAACEDRNRTAQRDLQFVIATNLAVVTDEIFEFCSAHKILISTSLDGPGDLHNANRPRPGGDSYRRTIDGIERARAVIGLDRVGALMTTTHASLGRVKDIVDEYVARGFTSIFLRPLSPYGFARKTKWYDKYGEDQWLAFYFEGLDYIVEMNRRGFRFVEHYAATILTKMLTPFDTGYVDLMSPAGIGIGAIVYNYDGDVYASDEGRMLAEMGDRTFRLGNVHRDTYDDIFTSDALLDPLEDSFATSAPQCTDCAFEPYCGADPVFHFATQGDYLGVKPLSAFCRRNMSIFRGLIARMEADYEVRRIFTSWIA